jgi:hypothetical protein
MSFVPGERFGDNSIVDGTGVFDEGGFEGMPTVVVAMVVSVQIRWFVSVCFLFLGLLCM